LDTCVLLAYEPQFAMNLCKIQRILRQSELRERRTHETLYIQLRIMIEIFRVPRRLEREHTFCRIMPLRFANRCQQPTAWMHMRRVCRSSHVLDFIWTFARLHKILLSGCFPGVHD
jgi:hypothetical protein